MDLDVERDATVTGETPHGLTFDSGSALLIATFNNEMAVYRARREWQKVLNAYFLLDPERDYEMWITPVEGDSMSYLLTCMFHSACGRYAFWRVINDQSPEAENKLAFGSDSYAKNDGRWFSPKRKHPEKDQPVNEHWELSEEHANHAPNSRSFVDYLMALLR